MGVHLCVFSRLSSAYPKSLCVAVLGTPAQLKNNVGNRILHDMKAFLTVSNHLTKCTNRNFHVINMPNFFDEHCQSPDQQIIDFMAISHPGPDLFILVVDPAETAEEKVVAQLTKLGDIFGEAVFRHVTVLLQDVDSYQSLHHLMDRFNVTVALNKENLAGDCRIWCHDRKSFLYQYSDYGEKVVKRRKDFLENNSKNPTALNKSEPQGQHPSNIALPPNGPSHQAPVHGTKITEYTMVLLGRCGAGKSASGNTILKAGKRKTTMLFKSEASSVPVTTQCEPKFTQFGIPVRVVDTPDFFSNQLPNVDQQIAQCREYCRSELCTILLVLQLGRLSENEMGLLDRFENTLGTRIRDRTIILLTHAEDLKGGVTEYFNASAPLLAMVQQCHGRYHLFNNNSPDRKQVKNLLKMIPNHEAIFKNDGKKDDCRLG
ncbi:uncharacterized protein ACB058_004584 [Synchiropus picturatus]